MAKVIIGIHGLKNKVSKDLLEDWWRKSIIEGLSDNLNIKDCTPKFEMVYWADILNDKPLDPNVSDKNSPLYNNEPYLPKDISFIPEKNPIRKRLMNYFGEKIDSVLLNDDLTNNYQLITNKVMHTYFEDMAVYYSDAKIRNDIRQRLADTIKKHKKDDIMILSHSMGTMIAYEVLTHLVPEVKINTFVTMGSPLAFPLIKARIGRELNITEKKNLVLRTPENVTNAWYNFSDITDKVAFNYVLSNDYIENKKNVSVTDFEVFNDYKASKRNPHKSYGYLRTHEVSRVIWQFAQKRRNPLFDSIIATYRKTLQRLKDFIKK